MAPLPGTGWPQCSGLRVRGAVGDFRTRCRSPRLPPTPSFFLWPFTSPDFVLRWDRLDLTARFCPRNPSAADVGIRIRFSKSSSVLTLIALSFFAGSGFSALCVLPQLSSWLTSLPAAPRVCGGGKAPAQAPFVSVAPS